MRAACLMQTPTMEARVYDLPVPQSLVQPMNVRRLSTPARSFYDLIDKALFSSGVETACKIRTDRIDTYDQVCADA